MRKNWFAIGQKSQAFAVRVEVGWFISDSMG